MGIARSVQLLAEADLDVRGETGLPADVALDTVRKYKPEVVETTPAVVSDEQTVLKQFVDAGVIAKAPPTTGAFDASFNASLSH